MKQPIKEIFSFSKAERRGIFLLLLIIFILLVYDIFGPFNSNYTSKGNSFQQEIEQFLSSTKKPTKNPIETTQTQRTKRTESSPALKTVLKPRPFDPNLMTTKQWLDMGLSRKQANTIEKYKAKGGWFRKPEDFKKMYCISQEEYEMLLPYIIIKSEYKEDLNKEKSHFQVDLNTVSIDEIQRVRGIGPSFAKRIIGYRKLLGGYSQITQLQEVYGMDDERYQQIKTSFTINIDSIKPLPLNTSTYFNLRYHPYISNDLAYEIVDYRKLHGNFKSVEDLRKISLMTDSLYQKIYLYFAAD